MLSLFSGSPIDFIIADSRSAEENEWTFDLSNVSESTRVIGIQIMNFEAERSNASGPSTLNIRCDLVSRLEPDFFYYNDQGQSLTHTQVIGTCHSCYIDFINPTVRKWFFCSDKFPYVKTNEINLTTVRFYITDSRNDVEDIGNHHIWIRFYTSKI